MACRLSLRILRAESFLSAKLTSTRGSPTASMSLDGSVHGIVLHFITRPFLRPGMRRNMYLFNRLTAIVLTSMLLCPTLPLEARTKKGDKFLAEGRLRSEEHTSELQSRQYLVCRLL